MAEVKNSDIPDIFQFMSEIWKFMKKFWIPENEDLYWESVVSEADKIMQRYGDDFCQGCILFVLDYLEWKGQKDTGGTSYRFIDWLYARYAQRAKTISNKEDAGNDNK